MSGSLPTLPLLAGALVVLLGATAALLLRDRGARQLQQRVDRFVLGSGTEAAGGGNAQMRAALSVISLIGDRVRRNSRLYSERDLEALASVLQASGFPARRAIPIVLGTKIVLVGLLPVAALAYGTIAGLPAQDRLMLAGAGLAAGLLGPDGVLGFMRRRYVKQIKLGMSDALDLLVVCSEAGMGLDNALEQVSREMQHSNPPIALALSGFLDDLRLLPDRREAYANFGNRLGVPELKRTATMLAQSQRYGAPLSQALRAVANELRRERIIRMEEKAMRLPAMLVFPLILFILPTLFIVLIGPAALKMTAVFSGFAK